VLVFASDHPHPEGGKDAVARFRRELEGRVDESARERFFGRGAQEVLAIGA